MRLTIHKHSRRQWWKVSRFHHNNEFPSEPWRTPRSQHNMHTGSSSSGSHAHGGEEPVLVPPGPQDPCPLHWPPPAPAVIKNERWCLPLLGRPHRACSFQCPSGYIKVPEEFSMISSRDEFALKGVWGRGALGQSQMAFEGSIRASFSNAAPRRTRALQLHAVERAASDLLREHTRLSVFRWNPGPKTGTSGTVEQHIAGPWTPTSSSMNSKLLTFTGAPLSSTRTDLETKSIFVPGNTQYCRECALEANFRRVPKDGKSSFTMTSLHFDNVVAKRRSIAHELLLTVCIEMIEEAVDLVAGDFSGTSWRRKVGDEPMTDCIIEHAFINSMLPPTSWPHTVVRPWKCSGRVDRCVRVPEALQVSDTVPSRLTAENPDMPLRNLGSRRTSGEVHHRATSGQPVSHCDRHACCNTQCVYHQVVA